MFNKKAITFNLVTLIILAIVIFLTAILFIRMYQIAVDDGNRNLCNFEGVKGQIQNMKAGNFWDSYELKCKAQNEYLEYADLRDTKLSQSVLDASEFKGTPEERLNEDVKIDLQVKNHFAKQMQSCWSFTGDRDVFSDYSDYIPSLNPETGLISAVTNPTRKNALVEYLGEYASASAIEGLTMCLVCSNTYFDEDLTDFGSRYYSQAPTISASGSQQSYKFTSFLMAQPPKDGANINFFTEMSKGKTTESRTFPLYVDTSTAQSVVYMQWFNAYAPKQDISRTAVIVVPTEQIMNVCDILTNQI